MYFDTLMEQNDFDSDELDNLDIVWTKDSPPSEEDDLIYGGSKEEYRAVSPLSNSPRQPNESPSISSLNYSSDGETDYEVGFKEPNSTSPNKKKSLFQYDSKNCNKSFGGNTSKSQNFLISSASSLLNNNLKEKLQSNISTEESTELGSPTNFRRFFPIKCDDNSKSDFTPLLRHSTALQHDKLLNQERQEGEIFRKSSYVYYDFNETKSRIIEDTKQFNRHCTVGRSIRSERDSDEIESSFTSGETVLDTTVRQRKAHQSPPSLYEEENVLIPVDNIRRTSPLNYDIHETIRSSSNFSGQTMKSYCHPTLKKSILFSNDLCENENSSNKDMKFDYDRITPVDYDGNEDQSCIHNSEKTVTSVYRRSSPDKYDHYGNKSSVDYSEETEAGLVYRSPSPVKDDHFEKIPLDCFMKKMKEIHPSLNQSLDKNDIIPRNTTEANSVYRRPYSRNSKSDDIRRLTPADYDNNETRIPFDYSQEEGKFPLDCFMKKMKEIHPSLNQSLDKNDIIPRNTTEANSVYRRPYSRNSKSDDIRRLTPADYDNNETRIPFDYSQEEGKFPLDCFMKKMKEIHPSLNQSLDKNDIIPRNTTEANSVYRRPYSRNSKSDDIRRLTPADYDNNETRIPFDYSQEEEKFPLDCFMEKMKEIHPSLNQSLDKNDIIPRKTTEANSVYRRPYSRNSKSDDIRRLSPADYDNETRIPFDYSQEEEKFPLDCFMKKMKEIHPSLNQSLDKNDIIPCNRSSSDEHKIFKSKDSSVEKQEENNSEVNVSEEHYLYLWALVNGIILDEEKIVEPFKRLLNLTNKSEKTFTKTDLENISSLIDRQKLNISDGASNINLSNENYIKLNRYFESIEKNTCLNCELKINKCVCLKRSDRLKNENEILDYTKRTESEISRNDCPSFNNVFSGMGRGKLLKEKLLQSKRLGLNDNNPLVTSNVGRGVAIKNLLKNY
ncbi:hypothetical protein O3M35_003343 [Rhynocoris fuscipes]|uniref:Uncharacterized protein n=1 Tax=Rhynocoris fuscipes TaxID=488301 RepID=A0AAW1CK21_9HEMI